MRPDREEEAVPARLLAEALQLRGLRRKQTYCRGAQDVLCLFYRVLTKSLSL